MAMRMILLILVASVGVMPAGDMWPGGRPDLVYHLVSDQNKADLDFALLKKLQQREDRANEKVISDKSSHEGWAMYVTGRDLEPLFVHPVPGDFRVLSFMRRPDRFVTVFCKEVAQHHRDERLIVDNQDTRHFDPPF